MLSTGNPPPDLPCPCEISQLKSSSSNIGSDERASDSNQHQLEVNLLKSGLDDNNPLPKFSIRDYVSNTRGKDVKNNWPFSQKNLQLCLKHGVKDVLPPFQSLDSVRNPSIVKCAVENTSCSDVKLSELSDRIPGQKLAVDIEKINSSGSEEDREFPSTTTSQSCSDINSVPPIKSPYLEPEAETSLGYSTEEPEFAVRASNKVEKTCQNPVKKCRLTVKLSNIIQPKSNEDLAVITSVVSETMASKVCPVCKTFSSSSNTTLNAHIDQCLSGESTIKSTIDSKVIKHRIKPRKTRLMVDIYETALHCTLEDLDRRNGTNWASNLGFPAQDLEACAEEKNKTFSCVNMEDSNEEGVVYIDSNGTKLRILSKLSDLPSNSNAKYDCGSSKLVKRDKGSKFLSSKKKKYLVQKHKLLKHPLYGQRSCSTSPDHLLKYPPYGQRSCSLMAGHSPEVNDGQHKKFPPEGYKKDDLTQPLIAHDPMESDGLGMIKQWVGSKRTGLKKINLDNENQNPGKSRKNLRVKSSLSSPGDMFVKRTSSSKSPISSDENPVLPTESCKRKENVVCNSHDGYMDQPCLRKRSGFSLLKSRDSHGKKNHLMFSKCNVKQSKILEPSSVHGRSMDPPNGTENHMSSRSSKKMRMSLSPAINVDGSFIRSRMSQHHAFSSQDKEFASLRKTSSDHAISSRSKKFSSLRKNLSSVRHASDPESKKDLGRKSLDFKNPRLHHASGSDEGTVVSRSSIYRQDNLVETLGENLAQIEKASGKSLINRTRVLKIQKKRGEFVTTGKGDVALKGSETSPEYDSHGVGKNIDSLMGDRVPVCTSNVQEEVEIRNEFVCEATSKIADGEAFIAFSKTLDSAFSGLAGPPNVECVTQHYIKAYEELCSAELVLGGEEEMFHAEKVGKDMVTPNTHLVAEMNANEEQGNYFVDADPIPIPGPPGSFLPSPGRMDSEELQGNSSLTTCRIQSSEDEHELVDMDSSDCAVSARSMVSESDVARSDSVSYINLSMRPHGVQPETQCDISQDKINPAVEGSTPLEQAASAERELNLHESRANTMLPEMSTRDLKNIEPCCCSRKDRALQSASLNYGESQLLRRRTMTSLPFLDQEKQMAGNAMNNMYSFNLRSETLREKEPPPEPEKIAANSPMGYGGTLVSHNSGSKFPTCGDSESPSPSTSTPVLRLMGKNLMVVNKDESLSPQTRPTQSNMVMNHPGLQSHVDNGVSTGHEHHSFRHTVSRGPSIFDNMQTSMQAKHFDFNSSHGFNIPADFRTPQLSAHPSTVMVSSKSFGGSFTSSFTCHEFAGRYDIEKVLTPVPQVKTANSCGRQDKEIIVIDDAPESEAGLAIKATHCDVNMAAGESSVGISASMVLGCDSRHVNPFYGYQTRGYPLCSGSPMVQSGNTQVPPSKGTNANLSKWNCTPEGSIVMQPNSLTTSLSSTGRLRSSLYFSPGFS